MLEPIEFDRIHCLSETRNTKINEILNRGDDFNVEDFLNYRLLGELSFSKFHHPVTLRCFFLNVFSLLSSRENSAKRADLFLTTVSRFHYQVFHL